jgi:uncharacterized protein
VITALADTGPLVALMDDDDPFHDHYDALMFDGDEAPRLFTTWPCVVEATHLLSSTSSHALLEWVGRGGVQVFPYDAQDLAAMVKWMRIYTQPPRTRMDFADATLYWLAVETGLTKVMTIDRRDFSRYRLPDGRPFEIL